MEEIQLLAESAFKVEMEVKEEPVDDSGETEEEWDVSIKEELGDGNSEGVEDNWPSSTAMQSGFSSLKSTEEILCDREEEEVEPPVAVWLKEEVDEASEEEEDPLAVNEVDDNTEDGILSPNERYRDCRPVKHSTTILKSLLMFESPPGGTAKFLRSSSEDYWTGVKLYQCSMCKKNFSRQDQTCLTGENLFKSHVCNSCSAQKELVSKQMPALTGDDPSEISTCMMSFATKRLVEHMRTQTGDKPFSRPAHSVREKVIALVENADLSAAEAGRHCGVPCRTAERWVRQYRKTGDLGRRARRSWRVSSKDQDADLVNQARENPFYNSSELKRVSNFPGSARTALKRLRDAGLLTQAAVVNKEKPFSCDSCEMGFVQKHHLVAHMRSHTGKKKTFECSTCNKGFVFKGYLDHHIRAHTNDNPCMSTV